MNKHFAVINKATGTVVKYCDTVEDAQKYAQEALRGAKVQQFVIYAAVCVVQTKLDVEVLTF